MSGNDELPLDLPKPGPRPLDAKLEAAMAQTPEGLAMVNVARQLAEAGFLDGDDGHLLRGWLILAPPLFVHYMPAFSRAVGHALAREKPKPPWGTDRFARWLLVEADLPADNSSLGCWLAALARYDQRVAVRLSALAPHAEFLRECAWSPAEIIGAGGGGNDAF